MSDYEYKGGRLVSKDSERTCLCTVSLLRLSKERKAYPANCAVIEDDIVKVGGISVAKNILKGIQDNPEMFGPDNMTFQYVFPKLDNMSVILRFSGDNMDSRAYETLVFGLADTMYQMLYLAFDKMGMEPSAKAKAVAIVDHMRVILSELESEGVTSTYERE